MKTYRTNMCQKNKSSTTVSTHGHRGYLLFTQVKGRLWRSTCSNCSAVNVPCKRSQFGLKTEYALNVVELVLLVRVFQYMNNNAEMAKKTAPNWSSMKIAQRSTHNKSLRINSSQSYFPEGSERGSVSSKCSFCLWSVKFTSNRFSFKPWVSEIFMVLPALSCDCKVQWFCFKRWNINNQII